MATQVGFYEHWRDMMRSWGHTVLEAKGWATRDAEPKTPYKPSSLYVEHHDASSLLSGNWGALAYITNSKLANIVTARDGQIMLVAAGVMWHAGVGGPRADVGRNLANRYSLGNEVANSGRESYSPGCTAAVIATEAAWAIASGRQGELSSRLLGHKDWATPTGRKTDPSLNMDTRRAQVTALIAERSGSRPPTVPAAVPAPPRTPSVPAVPTLPRWALPRGHWYGHRKGPAQSHGGHYAAERDEVQAIQRRFISTGCVPGMTDWRSAWADGLWEDATSAACRRWFARYRPGQQYTDRIYSDDYAVLARQ
jgi:hypothetical protein